MTWGCLSYWPALNGTSLVEWGLEGMQVSLLFVGAVKRKEFHGVFSVLKCSARWYSSVRAKPFPALSLFCQIGAFQAASLCSCQLNQFTENPGLLRRSESITCSAPALPVSAIKAQHPTSPPMHLSHTSPTRRGWALMPSGPLAYLAKAEQVRDPGL